jgi:hypothetical protein
LFQAYKIEKKKMVNKPFVWEHSAELALRRVLNKRLSDEVSCPVYNGNAPRNKNFPYMIIGESTENEFFTKLSNGSELVITFHIYTMEDGYDEIDGLKGQLFSALSGAPFMFGDPNWKLVSHGLDGSRKFRFDATKAHAIVYFRFKMQYIET